RRSRITAAGFRLVHGIQLDDQSQRRGMAGRHVASTVPHRLSSRLVLTSIDRPNGERRRGMLDQQQAAFEVWKATIEVQKHFNEISLRVRSIAVTVLGAFLDAAGYALNEQTAVTVLKDSVPLTALI